jgi:hypothetical protein
MEKLTLDFPDLNWGDYAVDFREPHILDDFIDSLKPKDEAPLISLLVIPYLNWGKFTNSGGID